MKSLVKAYNCNLVILVGQFFSAFGHGDEDQMLYLIDQIKQAGERFPEESFDFSYPIPYTEWEYTIKDVIATYEINNGEDTIFIKFEAVRMALHNILWRGGSEDLGYNLSDALGDLYRFMEVNELFIVPGEEQYTGYVLEY